METEVIWEYKVSVVVKITIDIKIIRRVTSADKEPFRLDQE